VALREDTKKAGQAAPPEKGVGEPLSVGVRSPGPGVLQLDPPKKKMIAQPTRKSDRSVLPSQSPVAEPAVAVGKDPGKAVYAKPAKGSNSSGQEKRPPKKDIAAAPSVLLKNEVDKPPKEKKQKNADRGDGMERLAAMLKKAPMGR